MNDAMIIIPVIANAVRANGSNPVNCSEGKAVLKSQSPAPTATSKNKVLKMKEKKLRSGRTSANPIPKAAPAIRKSCKDPENPTPGIYCFAIQRPAMPAKRETNTA